MEQARWCLRLMIVWVLALVSLACGPGSSDVVTCDDPGPTLIAAREFPLAPAFDKATLGYAIAVPYATKRVTFDWENGAADSVTVLFPGGSRDGKAVRSVEIELGPGDKSFVYRCSCSGKAAKEYTVAIRPALPESRLGIKEIKLIKSDPTTGSDVPVGNATQKDATTFAAPAVENAVETYRIAVTLEGPLANLTVAGAAANASQVITLPPLKPGINAIPIVVASQDLKTSANYTLNIERLADNNASLSGLSLSTGTLVPAFSKDVTAYNAAVAVNSLTVGPTAQSGKKTTITVNGTPVVSGEQSAPIEVRIGDNTITVECTAQDGVTKKTYVVTVYASGVTLFAGTALQSGFANGAPKVAKFSGPAGIVADSAGNFFVADTGNHRIRKVSASGVVSDFVGSGAVGSADGVGAAASFNAPTGLAIDPTGTIYVADSGNHSVRSVTPTGSVTTMAGGGVPGDVDGVQSEARFNNPTAVAWLNGVVYVSDTNNNRIRKIVNTHVVSTLTGQVFDQPMGILIYSANLYVADRNNHVIRSVDINTGAFQTLSGTTGVAGYVNSSVGPTAKYNAPVGLALDSTTSTIIVTEAEGHIIRRMNPAGGGVTLVAGVASTPGFFDGPTGAAKFSSPLGVWAVGKNIYVTEKGNHDIRQVSP